MHYQSNPSLVQVMACRLIGWTNDDILSIWLWGTHFNDILFEIQKFTFKSIVFWWKLTMVNDKELIIPPLNEVEGGYTGFTLSAFPSVCLFIRLWTECCPLCIFHNTIRVHFIFRHLINQLQKVCHLLSFVKNSKIWIFRNFFKFAPLTLPCVYAISMLRVDSST